MVSENLENNEAEKVINYMHKLGLVELMSKGNKIKRIKRNKVASVSILLFLLAQEISPGQSFLNDNLWLSHHFRKI